MPEHASTNVLEALEEPLGQSAPIARKLALKHCARHNPESSCLLYHSAWQYFRLIGLIRTIFADDDFLGSALNNLAATGQFDRVLISGSADYGMLARVLHVYRQLGREPRITLVDICQTPLELNRWLSLREDLQLNVVQGDMLQFRSTQPFDLICTHSFIGRFYRQRPQLLAAWYGLLRPGGCIVTTARIRSGINEIVRFSPAEVRQFADRAHELAVDCSSLGAVRPETIAGWARQYAQHKFNYPLSSCAEFAEYFTSAGLQVTELDRTSGRSDRPSGPILGIRSERIRIVATRP